MSQEAVSVPEVGSLKRELDETVQKETPVASSEQDSKRIKLETEADSVIDTTKRQVSNGITEKDVGITEFVCKNANRINGVLKERYSDFMVNEIDMDSNVVHLLDEGIPDKRERRRERREKERQEHADADANGDVNTVAVAAPAPAAPEKPVEKKFELSEEQKAELVNIFGEEDTEKIIGLLTNGSNIETVKKFDDKEERTKIHRVIRKFFQNKLETITTADNAFKIALSTNSNTRRKRDRTNESKLEHNLGPQKDFLHFVIYKENKETMEIAGILAKLLKIPIKWLKYAGTKDRRGITVQKASVEKLSVERLNSINRILKGARIGGFEYNDDPLKLGDLKGNEFIITIKDAQTNEVGKTVEESIKPILKSLSEDGFINYFGMQRFGTFSISTHQIGREILKSNWKEAVELILAEQEVVFPKSIEARKIWKNTKNPTETLRKMPRKCSAEFSILSRLEKTPKESNGEYSSNSYFTAIMGIPRNLRIMYGHSYQSYIWNVAASERIKLFGLKVVAGDLVLIKDDEDKEAEKEKKTSSSSTDPDEFDPDNDDNIQEDVKKDQYIRARVVTEEEIKENKYTIYDVVLPTPGFDVQYPENEQLRKVYSDIMAKDGLDPFNMARKVREFSLAGTYRHVMAKVEHLEYHIRHYADSTEQLVRTDLELLRLKQQAIRDNTPEMTFEQILPESEAESNDKKTAIIIKMQLGVSTYATMCLRELLTNQL
ncbi:hypothetical protein B5S28_g1978 [[Candida] boidinii]|nr:hypothetical protein B5S28_g1978 [[Candida] boidinii]